MSQATPSGSKVSKVESDVLQTLKLGESFVTVLREPVVMLYQNYTKSQELKRSLGEWHGEASGGDKLCRIPVLGATEFDQYLVDTDGHLSPAANLGKLQRKACWAYLLQALGIQPGKKMVGWRPSTDGFISTQNGGIEMEFEGAVLCHIMNLYSTTLDPKPFARYSDEFLPNRSEQKRCRFPFGELVWDTTDGQIHAHFQPGSEGELNSGKEPFGAFA